jgi:hypothetical protein
MCQFTVHAMWDSVYLTMCIASISLSFEYFSYALMVLCLITLLITHFVVSGHRM